MKLNPNTLVTLQTLLRADGWSSAEIETFVHAIKPHTNTHKLGTVRQAAEILQCHPRTVQRYAALGLLHPVKHSCRRVRFNLDEIERFSQEGRGVAQ